MQKISKQLTTFIDHRQNGESLWLKKLEKISVIKFGEKRITEIKFRSLFLKIKKHRHEKRVSLIYWERVTSLVREMHLRVPVETQQFRTVDLNWTCLFCSYGNETVGLRTSPISGSLFLTNRILDLFWTGLLDFSIPLCECNRSLPAFWN